MTALELSLFFLIYMNLNWRCTASLIVREKGDGLAEQLLDRNAGKMGRFSEAYQAHPSPWSIDHMKKSRSSWRFLSIVTHTSSSVYTCEWKID